MSFTLRRLPEFQSGAPSQSFPNHVLALLIFAFWGYWALRLRYSGFYDDTLLFVIHVERLPVDLLPFLSSLFDTQAPISGIPGSEFYSPGITTVLWVLDRLGVLGNMSLIALSGLFYFLFSLSLHRFMRMFKIETKVLGVLLVFFVLNPANSEFVYFFISNQHLLTCGAFLFLITTSRELLDLKAEESFLMRYAIRLNIATILVVMFARETIAPLLVIGVIYLLLLRTWQSRIVLFCWMTPLLMLVRQLATDNLGLRLSSAGLPGFSDLVPDSIRAWLSENGLTFVILIVGLSAVLQILAAKIGQSRRTKYYGFALRFKWRTGNTVPSRFLLSLVSSVLLIAPQSTTALLLAGLPITNLFSDYRLLNESGGVGYERWSFLIPQPVSLLLLGALIVSVVLFTSSSIAGHVLIFVSILFSLPFLNALSEELVPSRYFIYYIPALAVLLGSSMFWRWSQDLRTNFAIASLIALLLVASAASMYVRVSDATVNKRHSFSSVCNHLFYPLEPDLLAQAMNADSFIGRKERSLNLIASAAAQASGEWAWPTCKNWPQNPVELLFVVVGGRVSGLAQSQLNSIEDSYRREAVWTEAHTVAIARVIQSACISSDPSACSGLRKLNTRIARYVSVGR